LRVQKSANGTTTVYIYSGSKDIAEYDNGAAPSSPSREFIYGNGELLATVSGGATTYYQKDHLSVRMTTDSNGSVLGQQGHFPFGESWYSSNGSSEWVFTTYQHNQETGLEYALARYYDPRTAAFCSADPVSGDPSDPESWNRYVYARDNPINLTDPSGQFWLFDVLKIVGLIAADVISGGVTQFAFETLSPLSFPDLIGTLGLYAETGRMVSHEINQAKQQGSPNLPPPLRLPTNDRTLRINCVTFALDAQFPQADFKPQNPAAARTVGGHINPTEQATVPTQTADDIENQIKAQGQHSMIPGTRFPSGLHIPHPGDITITPVPNSSNATIQVTGHIDSATPVDVATGIKHGVRDVGWGHVKGWLHLGDIDKRCKSKM